MALDTSLVLNLVLCGLGAGILSLPWTVAGAGVLNSLVWTALVLWVCYFTIMLLVEAGEWQQCFSLEELLEKAVEGLYAPGGLESKGPLAEAKRLQVERARTWWSRSCTGAIWATYILCLIGYLIIIADSVLPTLSSLGVLDTLGLPASSARSVVLVVAMASICPLCFMSQAQLSFTSLLGTFSNCFIVFALMLNYAEEEIGGWSEEEESRTARPFSPCLVSPPMTKGNLAFVSAVLMAIVIQPCTLPMYAEMPDATRTPQNFAKALKVAFGFLYLLFCAFGIVGYLSFGSGADGNILNNLPSQRWYTVTSRLSMAVVCLGVYPLMLYPMVNVLREKRRTLGVLLVNALVLFVSMHVDNLGAINVACGALSVFFFVGLYPAVIALGVLNRSGGSASGLRSGLQQSLLFGDAAPAKSAEPDPCYGVVPMALLTILSLAVMALGLMLRGNGSDELVHSCTVRWA